MHLLLALRVLFGVLLSSAVAQQKCNGFAELCDRSVGNVTFIGAHDSFAYTAISTGATVGNGLSSTQNKTVSTQLQDGVRMLQGQGHHKNPGQNSTVELCHTDCGLLDGGSLTDYLKKVVLFLDANPDEVLIFLWVNSEDPFPVSAWGNSYEASGLDKYSYTPKQTPVKNTAWPTLSELIADGKRAVSFMDIGADYGSIPYILDEFSMIFETVPDPQDNNFACDFDRPHGGSPDGLMYLINHNLNKKVSNSIVVPDFSAANITNSACGLHTIQQQVSKCQSLYDRNPNIILLDYYDLHAIGSGPFEAANYLNGVGPDPCDESSPGPTGSTSSSSPSATDTITSPTGSTATGSSTNSAATGLPTSSSSGIAIPSSATSRTHEGLSLSFLFGHAVAMMLLS